MKSHEDLLEYEKKSQKVKRKNDKIKKKKSEQKQKRNASLKLRKEKALQVMEWLTVPNAIERSNIMRAEISPLDWALGGYQ